MRAAAALFFISLTLLFANGATTSAGRPPQVPAAQSPIENDSAEREPLLGLGKKLFVSRCASCHNDSGDKPLSSGPPLAERKLTPEVVVRNVNGRFRTATDEERRAVALYIQSFLKK